MAFVNAPLIRNADHTRRDEYHGSVHLTVILPKGRHIS